MRLPRCLIGLCNVGKALLTITPACLFPCRINKQQIVPIRVPVVPPGQFQTFQEPFVDKSHVAQGLSLGQTHLATSGGLLCKYDVPCIGDFHSCHRSRRSPEPPYKDTAAVSSQKTHGKPTPTPTRYVPAKPLFPPSFRQSGLVCLFAICPCKLFVHKFPAGNSACERRSLGESATCLSREVLSRAVTADVMRRALPAERTDRLSVWMSHGRVRGSPQMRMPRSGTVGARVAVSG